MGTGNYSSFYAVTHLLKWQVAWRRILAPGDGVDALVLLRRPAAVVTLSGGGAVVRAWQAGDGLLLWDRAVCAPGEVGPGRGAPSVLPCAAGLGPPSVVVLCGFKLQVRTLTFVTGQLPRHL